MPILPRTAPSRAALSPFVCHACQQSLRRFSVTPTRRRAPPPPPPSGYAHLTSRRLISLAGPDAPKFLHGIITQSVIDEPSTSGNRHRHNAPRHITTATTPNAPGFYSGFLNATGRVLHDVFVYRDTLGVSGVEAADGEAFVIEVDADQVETLAKHIKRYKLRSKLSFRILDEGECAAWQVWDDSSLTSTSTPSTRLSQLKDSIVLTDTRAPGMGYRVLRRGKADGLDLDLEKSDDDAYRIRRYLLGVAEGQVEIPREQALPLESNMDVSGGIDFRKGCYVGQELTIRTRHRGVVRKRILPCLLYPSSPPPQRLEYRPYVAEGEEQISADDIPSSLSIGRDGTKGRSAGTWLRGVGNIGLALCRLQIMTDIELPGETAAKAPFNPDTDEFIVKWGADEEGVGGQSVKIKAFVPEWLRERLRETSNSASAH
ncbi:Aminomethyltransferase folate-binding domain-containing protein [Hypoxylon sp. FL1857]|nr:Aminomethyltransferase folate-binding domain-containing protein [Hypoxylon sp. FL1857]